MPAAAHAKKIVHGDINPANLFLTREGVVQVLDFAIARLRDVTAESAMHTGVLLGTAACMALETFVVNSARNASRISAAPGHRIERPPPPDTDSRPPSCPQGKPAPLKPYAGTKPPSGAEFRRRDSNPNKRIQSPLSCHWTTPESDAGAYGISRQTQRPRRGRPPTGVCGRGPRGRCA